MKTSFTTKAAAALALMMVSSASMAAIQLTRHNLGATRTGNANPNFTTATTEICVFCHTPHGADTKAQAPLWNRQMNTSASYQTYSSLGTSTLDAKSAPVGSVSLACLSCHDGTQAMNVVINSPGSGTATDGTGVGIGTGTGGTGKFGEFTAMSEVSGEMIYLSTDLRNDHPISIQYAGASSFSTAKDIDFASASSSTVNGQTVWYIETGANGLTGANATGLDKTDLKLYTRGGSATAQFNDGITGGAQPFVECASCHDPHVEATTFLRLGNNNNSRVCLTCHTK